MPTFILNASPEQVFATLFKPSEDNSLGFGCWTKSDRPASDLGDVVWPIRIRDYIMEGFVSYSVQLKPHSQGSELIVQGFGGDRDKYIPPALRHYIKAAKLELVSESE